MQACQDVLDQPVMMERLETLESLEAGVPREPGEQVVPLAPQVPPD